MQGEELLARACAKGDRASQRALYDRYCKKMIVICMRYAKSGQEAEDILQESFIKVFASIKNFRFESKLETWITRIVINTSLNHQRQKMYLLPMVDVDKISMVQTEDINLSDFHLSELIKMIQELPDGCRLVFNLFAIEGYSHKEIAEELTLVLELRSPSTTGHGFFCRQD